MPSDRDRFNKLANRRRVLQSIGATGLSIGGGVLSGNVGAKQNFDSQDNHEEEFIAEIELDTDLADAESKGPSTGLLAQEEYLEYFDDRSDNGTLSGPLGDIANVEWRITAYEAVDENGDPVTDSDGDNYYVIEFYALSEELYNKSETRELEVDAEFSDDATLHGRDPETSSSVNGRWLTIRQSFSVGGYGITTERDQYVNHGSWGPKTWVPGPNGEYGIYFDGETPADQKHNWDIIGLCRLSYSGYAFNLLNLIDDWDGFAEGYRSLW